MSTKGYSETVIKLKAQLPPGHFKLLLPRDQQVRKRITFLGGVLDCDYQEEEGWLLHREDGKEYIGSRVTHRGVSWDACPILIVNKEMQNCQLMKGAMGMSSDPLRLKVSIAPSEKLPRPEEVLAKDQDGDDEYQLEPQGQLQWLGL